MKSRSRLILVVFAALAAVPLLSAQTAAGHRALPEARQFREALVADVVAGRDQPEAALTRLKGRKGASGASRDDDADQGLAALDIGQRLLVAGRPAAAEKFFLDAEKALEKAVRRLPDGAAAEKAMLLNNLAFIRTRYLGKSDEARADLETAARLRPNDEHTKGLHRTLAKERGDEIKQRASKARR
jgi:tetratricopeptide (TPR) repeat protein